MEMLYFRRNVTRFYKSFILRYKLRIYVSCLKYFALQHEYGVTRHNYFNTTIANMSTDISEKSRYLVFR